MPLVITSKNETLIPIEVDTICLPNVREQPVDEVRRTLVQHGNKQMPLGEFFDVSGSAADDNEMVWRGDCSRVKLIAANLTEGRVRVEGDAGMHLGAEMTGGEVIVDGNAADWVGAEMHGGKIIVKGNAGHLVGAVYRGGRRGMTGGEIHVYGSAGNEIGHTMRRGMIAVGGDSGDAVGFGMIAGTVLLFGETGIRPGAGMRRGTIGLLGTNRPPDMLPTFKGPATCRPVFLHIFLRYLQAMGFPLPEGCLEARYNRYCGDFLELGKGEIFCRAS